MIGGSRTRLRIGLTALLVAISTGWLTAQTSPLSAQIQRALTAFIRTAHTWTATQTFNAIVVSGCTGCGGATVPGSDTNVLFNDGGSFGANANLTFDKAGQILGLTGTLTFGGDTSLARGSGAGQLTLSAGATATSFRVKNGSNAELGAIYWDGSNNFVLGTQGAVSGGTARDIILGSAVGASNGIYLATEATSRWQVMATGHLRPFATATYDLGDATHLARALYAGKIGNLTSNGFVKTSAGDGTLSVDTSTYLTAITGGTCTNQAVTAISTAGVPTCTTLTSAYTTGLIAASAGPQTITSTGTGIVQALTIASNPGSSGINRLVLNNTNGTGIKSSLDFASSGSPKWDIGNDFNSDGSANFFVYEAGTNSTRVVWTTTEEKQPSNAILGWTNGTAHGNSIDAAFARNTTGVLEVNNGTAGSYRDLNLRNLTASGTLNGLTLTTTTGTFTLTNGKTFAVTNGLTLSGTDSTTMTFPSTSATIARTDAANTFTGDQSFSNQINVGASPPTSTALLRATIPNTTIGILLKQNSSTSYSFLDGQAANGNTVIRLNEAAQLGFGRFSGSTGVNVDTWIQSPSTGLIDIDNGTSSCATAANCRDLRLRHLIGSGTAPTVASTTSNSCGTTSPTIAGTDSAGKVTVGATSGTSCTVTFGTAYANAPACQANNETTSNLMRSTTTTTTAIIAGTMVGGDVLSYVCIGY